MSNNVPPSLSNFTQHHCSESWITITQLNHLQVTVTTLPPHLPPPSNNHFSGQCSRVPGGKKKKKKPLLSAPGVRTVPRRSSFFQDEGLDPELVLPAACSTLLVVTNWLPRPWTCSMLQVLYAQGTTRARHWPCILVVPRCVSNGKPARQGNSLQKLKWCNKDLLS